MLKTNYQRLLIFFSIRLFNDLNLITLAIFILGFFNIFYKIRLTSEGFISAVNLWNPTWLLFGPFLLYAYRVVNKKSKREQQLVNYLHFLPFIIFSVFYLIAKIYTDMDDPWQNILFIYYQNSFFVIIISLLSYAIYVLTKTQNTHVAGGALTEIFLISISTIYLLSGIIVALMYLAWGIIKVDVGIDYRMFSYSLLFLGNLTIVWFWLLNKKQKTSLLGDQHNEPSYRKSTLDQKLADTYKERIIVCFERSEIYLEPNLSLETLSQELNIPKHYLSQLFNVFFKKNFHAFVAAYRIDYAIKLLNDNHNRLTIESLAYSCGFNSKTSFNRYFKNRTGLTPSAYQLKFS